MNLNYIENYCEIILKNNDFDEPIVIITNIDALSFTRFIFQAVYKTNKGRGFLQGYYNSEEFSIYDLDIM